MATLSPAPAVIAATKASIISTLATELPSEIRATAIAPLLSQVNQWATQIPALVESIESVNLIFAIRKALFNAPYFNQCVLGGDTLLLPPAFQEFLNFVAKLIESQKPDKDKPSNKVCLSYSFFFYLALTLGFFFIDP